MAGTFEEVRALLDDPAFREDVAREAGATEVEVTVEEYDDDSLVATLDTVQPTDDMPTAARKFLGHELRVHQVERWTSPGAGTMEVRIPGQPGHVVGTVTLQERDGTTVETVDADITVRIPFLGGRLEAVIGRVLGHVLKIQAAAVTQRLGPEPDPGGGRMEA